MSKTREAWYAEHRRRNADPTLSMCEFHDRAGECDEECLRTLQYMSDPGGGESMVYSDYLGGESSIDVSGCHGGPPRAYETIILDPEARRLYYATVHEWEHTRKGLLTGWVHADTGEWVDLVLTHDHDGVWLAPSRAGESVAAGTVLRVRKSMLTRLTDPLPHEEEAQ